MKNILQKFKEFPLSIKIIVIFCVIAIFDVLEGLHEAINNIYNKDGGTVTTVILFIIAAVFVISFLMQLINIFKKDKKAYTFSKIQSRLALAVCFLFPISMMFFRLGFIIDGPIFLRNFFGFTFLICSRNSGMTEPLLPKTFPYLTEINLVLCFSGSIKLFAVTNNFSISNFVAP